MQTKIHHTVMDRLRNLGEVVGISPPAATESLAEYGARILNSINPDDELQDDEVRFLVLALINQRVSP